MLALMPLLNESQVSAYEQTKECLVKLFALLMKIENSTSVKLDYLLSIYLNWYNNFDGSNGLKADCFLALMRFVKRLNRVDIMIERMRQIGRDCANWTMTVEEKRNLLKEVAHALERVNDPAAF